MHMSTYVAHNTSVFVHNTIQVLTYLGTPVLQLVRQPNSKTAWYWAYDCKSFMGIYIIDCASADWLLVAETLVMGGSTEKQVLAGPALQAIRSQTLAGKALQAALVLAYCGLRLHVSQAS